MRATELSLAIFDPTTVYNQWTSFRPDFDPTAAGLTLMPSPIGDFDANDLLDVADVDRLASVIRDRSSLEYWFDDDMVDVNADGDLDERDLEFWVKELKRTWFGDTNLDGEFNSTDLVKVFAVGQYEDAIAGNSTWAAGDWNGDGDFNSSDIIVAFIDGGDDKGRRGAVVAVPEPSGFLLQMIAAFGVLAVLKLPRFEYRWRNSECATGFASAL